MPPGPGPEQARQLVRAVASGDVAAWHRFIGLYAGLVHVVTRRYLAFASRDIRRDVFVDILGKLRAGAVKTYDGRSSLSTWLYIYSRSRCIDYLRTSELRWTRPVRWNTLSALDRRVIRLYWLERLGRAEILILLQREGHALTIDDLARILERLESGIGNRMRRRLAFDLCAQSIGMTSGRLLEYLHELRIDNEARQDGAATEWELLQDGIEQAIVRVRERV